MLIQPNQLMGMPVATSVVAGAARKIEQHVKELPEAAVTTARALISAEERLRQRIGSALRVTLATLFFLVSGLISLGANAAVAAASALAKKVSPQSEVHERSHRAKRTKSHLRTKLHGRSLVLRHSELHSEMSYHQRGIASWYGNQFDHRRTASGVRFNTHAMMAAHRTLPFGSKVRVTNMTNHKSCVVEITDRGPFKPGRIIDLSRAAAQQLDMAQTGTARVEIEVLGTETMFQEIASETYEDSSFEHRRPVFDGIPSTPERTLDSMSKAAPDQASR
ncbi:MAG: septal ring lytic transglycosylase RlpA family protein [Bacteroidota bacterium]|nr:septal ring lytic transglycosylase RlpA family protein [Bacteroidota bacterium]MDP4232719.1 septal ring lytic transglycosylase RlpA family protein [Bacteroidota bacterium]MDP4243148.1 septal ring lytic transglycosylase RlpA family protein [Bacteroidota bacterium]MDP4287605.1 septal ring lytic transglycosylase RlpA family protein [Bacteroidota bacterium]